MSDRRSVALWSVFGGIAVLSSALVLHRPAGDRLSDLHIYYGAVRHAQAGLPLYDFAAANGGPFTYPPFAALVLWPIGGLPEATLRVAWLVLTCAAVVAIATLVSRVLVDRATLGEQRSRVRVPWPAAGVEGRHRLVAAMMACALLLSAPVQSNLRFGQVSIFIVLLALVDATGVSAPGGAAGAPLSGAATLLVPLGEPRARQAGRLRGRRRTDRQLHPRTRRPTLTFRPLCSVFYI